MKKMIWVTTFFVLFLVFVVPAILASLIKMIPDFDQPGYNSDKRLAIYGQRIVTQSFISQTDNLTAIGTSIRNPNLKNKKDIILDLFDGSKKKIRTSTLNGQNIQDGDFVKFVFDPVLDSGGKTYFLTISSPLAGPEETIEVFYNTSITKNILSYTYDEKSYPGGLPIVTFRKTKGKIETVKEVYSNWFSRLLLLGFRKA